MWPFKKKKVQLDCTHCKYYAEFRVPPKLNPDKTVTPGYIGARECQKGDFELTDLNPCELFERLPLGSSRPSYKPKPPIWKSSIGRPSPPNSRTQAEKFTKV